MLELITSRKPIMEQEAMDKTKDLYNLHEFLDPVIGFGPMTEVIKVIEYIMVLDFLNPDASAASTSESYVTSS